MKIRSTLHIWLAWAGLVTSWALAWANPIAGAAGAPVRIALVSDTHITRGTKEDQPFHKGRFDRVILAVNAAQVDLVLIAGDLTEDGTRQEFTDFRRQITKLEAPVWYVPGNHDVGGKVILGKESPKDVTRGRLSTFHWKLGESWFVREHAGIRVVGINGSLLGSGLREEQAMWTMLDTALATPVTNVTLMLLHYPLFANHPEEPGGVYWNVEPESRRRLLALARQGGVKAVLSGHLHTERLLQHEGILFVTSPPVCFGLPRNRQYRGWTLLTIPPGGDVQAEFRYIVD